MMRYVIYFLLSICDILIPYFFICFFLEHYYKQEKLIFIYFIALLLHIMKVPIIIIQLLVLMINVYLNKKELQNKHIKDIYVYLVYLAIYMFIEVICQTIIAVTTGIPFTIDDVFQLNQYANIIYEVIILLSITTILNLKFFSNNISHGKNRILLTTIALITGLCLLLAQSYFNNAIPVLLIYTYFTGILLWLFFVIFTFFKDNIKARIENEKLNEQYKLNEYKLKSLLEKEQYYEELQKYKHDIKNNLLTLSYLLNNEDQVEANKYLGQLVGKLNENDSHLQFSEHPIINAIFNEKVRNNKHIQFQIKCNCSRKIFIDDLHCNILITNLVDNAIEYLNSHEFLEKYIHCVIIEHKEFLVISIENSIASSFQYNQSMPTSKEDKINHGYGLSIIRSVVNLYDGNMTLEQKNNMFCINILLKR